MNLAVQHRISTATTTCVVCRDTDGVVAVCKSCGTTTHAECAVESRGCPTIGCSRRDRLPVTRWDSQHIDLRPLRSSRPSRPAVPVDTRSRLDRALTEPMSGVWVLLLLAATGVVAPILYASWVAS